MGFSKYKYSLKWFLKVNSENTSHLVCLVWHCTQDNAVDKKHNDIMFVSV